MSQFKPGASCPKRFRRRPDGTAITRVVRYRRFTARVIADADLVHRWLEVRHEGKVILKTNRMLGHLAVGSDWDCDWEESDACLQLMSRSRDQASLAQARAMDRRKRATRYLAFGADVTGDGKPNLVVVHSLGGSSGAAKIFVYEVGLRMRKVLEQSFVSGQPVLDDLDGDGVPELLDGDRVEVFLTQYGVWKTWQTVPLRYDQRRRRYRPDLRLMKRPRMDLSRLHVVVDRHRGRLTNNALPDEVQQRVLERIYSGNLDQARAVLTRLLNAKLAESILRALLSRLRGDKYQSGSRFWKQIRALNRLR